MEEELIKKHKQEKKLLQANIQKMKQLVPKNDKKRRKELTQKIEDMEKELHNKQQEELDQFKKLNQLEDKNDKKEETVIEKLEQLQLNLENNQMNFKEEEEEEEENTKISKAQKRRERKEREQLERERRIAEGEKDNVNHVRIVEINILDKLLKEHNLKLYDIPSDGDCMYNAIRHQLEIQNLNKYNVEELRKLTANHLKNNKQIYLPFLLSKNKDELMNDNEFENYCKDIELNRKWGGNIELQILSKELKVNIQVYQADGPIIKFDCNCEPILKDPILISFHKYLYQLGSHYNSLIKIK